MDTITTIDAGRVREILIDCFFLAEEDKSKAVIAEGVMLKACFHPERLASHREEISVMLDLLPDEFKSVLGGGWSFLNACVDKNGNQWGDHRNMDELFCLGIAIGKVEFPLPREAWRRLPGGMPFVIIK